MMRFVFPFALLAGVALLAAPCSAQEDEAKKKKKPPLLEIENVQIGFYSYQDKSVFSRVKAGLWTPVYVQLKAGLEDVKSEIVLETIDSQDVGTIKTMPFTLDANQKRTFITYAKPGKINADIDITAKVGNKSFTRRVGTEALKLNAQVYLTAGANVPDLQKALVELGQVVDDPFGGGKSRTTWPRYAAYETDADRLPDNWLGYEGVDVVILTTGNKQFLTRLLEEKDGSRLRALATWVRRGGQLVVTVSWLNQPEVSRLFAREVWYPPVPFSIPANNGDVEKRAPQRVRFERWNLANKPFTDTKNKRVYLAQLGDASAAANWEVLEETDRDSGKQPLIVRVPYGRGSIVLTSFSVDEAPFALWEGRVDFWKALVRRLGPRSTGPQQQVQEFNDSTRDVTTSLLYSLDNFDVRIIPFGWVALFILVYILIVGPLDYVVLKFGFKKLEWTWITFPTVVAVVSIAAYYTAYAIKGDDQKINQVDILDIDMRTDLDDKNETRNTFVYGRSFFTILSPRIQNYTVGVQPNPAFWGAGNKETLVDSVTWLGQPEDNAFSGMGAGRGAQSFFRKPYRFAEDVAGLESVPIPVWTTKSFTATWESALKSPPIKAKLNYFIERDVKISGEIENLLPVDLENVWLFYRNQVYYIADRLPANGAASKAISLEAFKAQDIVSWVSKGETDTKGRPSSDKGVYDPAREIRQILFFQKADVGKNYHNHALRPLDISWRLQAESNWEESGMREAILYARVPFRTGRAEELASDAAQPLSSLLWLGQLPGRQSNGQPLPRPSLQGSLNQDTFIRVILPVSAPR